ncbi:uncharacterized protein LOC111830720 [Capsella rubella]|uniref:uncharacterized protein LOC111830720 n=1 Tax=Capsella rubella TaxID=81985 RepID=UPI000CD4CAA8|nr:uncharacterized protein LOC111830720 [Capsella rubella]
MAGAVARFVKKLDVWDRLKLISLPVMGCVLLLQKRQLDRVREQRKLLIDDYVAKGTIRFMEETKSD